MNPQSLSYGNILLEEIEQAYKQGRLGPRTLDQKQQQTISFHNQKYARWVEPDAGSQKPFAIQRRFIPPPKQQQFEHPIFGKYKGYRASIEKQYKKIERNNDKPFDIKYQCSLKSELWDFCPHCNQYLAQSIPLHCKQCGGIISFMVEYIEQPNYGKTKIAPHVLGCLKCPTRKNNGLFFLELNEDQLCVEHFDQIN